MVPPYTYHIYLDEKKNSQQRRVGTLRARTEDYMPEGCTLAGSRTAFPSNKEYYDHRVRDQGVNFGIWGDKK